MDQYISPANRQLKYRSDYTYFSEIFRLREIYIYFFVWAAEGAPRAGAATAPRRRQSVARRFCDPGGVGTRDPDPTKAAASSPGDLRPASSTLIRDLGYYSRLADDTFASGGRAGAATLGIQRLRFRRRGDPRRALTAGRGRGGILPYCPHE